MTRRVQTTSILRLPERIELAGDWDETHSIDFATLGLALGRELTEGMEPFVKDLRIRFLEDCSHWTQQDRPELVNRHIRDFLSEE